MHVYLLKVSIDVFNFFFFFFYCLHSFRVNHGRVRQGALHCLLVVVKAVEKRTLYGYWSSFIPDSPIGGSPPLTLVTIILKDLSPKVQHTHTHTVQFWTDTIVTSLS